jgi:hypothetical protein
VLVAAASSPPQPARLLARSKTLFRHYSIAASPCGNYVAATGNSGLLSLFRVQRSNSNYKPPAAAAAAAAAACAAPAAAGSDPSTAAAPAPSQQAIPGLNPAVNIPSAFFDADPAAAWEPGEDPSELEWVLVHVATLLCKNGQEVMVNSVRFGHFAGRLRMLVAHQVGVLKGRGGGGGGKGGARCLSTA